MILSPDDILDLLARDLDGDLDRKEKRMLFQALAGRPDAHALIGQSLALDLACRELNRAAECVEVPDFSGAVAAAIDAEAERAPPAKEKGLWGALKAAVAGPSDKRNIGARGSLDLADLAGVVAGTGSTPGQETDATGAPEDESPDKAQDEK